MVSEITEKELISQSSFFRLHEVVFELLRGNYLLRLLLLILFSLAAILCIDCENMDFLSYFYILFPFVSAIFLMWLVVFVLLQGKKINTISKLFVAVSFACALWLLGTFMMFRADIEGNDSAVLFWDRLIYAIVAFIPALEYHFGLVISKRHPNRLLYAAYGFSFIFLFLSQTDYFVSGLFRYEWGVHSVAGPLHHFFLIFFFVYIFAFLQILFHSYRNAEDSKEQARIILALIAFMILDLIGGLGFLPAYGIGIFPISLIAPVLFSSIIGYSIVRYKFLDVKIFAAQAAVITILILSGIRVLFSRSVTDFILDVILFSFIAAIGFFLVRSVKKEVNRKDELQEISTSLALANQRLKELDNTKTEFISIASHQLRTPLTAIKGYLSLVLEGSYGTLSSELRDVMEKVYSVNSHLIQLVEDLLNVSRVETGRVQYRYELVQLEALAAEEMDMFLPIAKNRGLELRINLPRKPLPKVSLDESKIKEVISNLIDNALKYTRNGSVTVSVERSGSDMARVSVRDTGIGFGAEDGKRLFKKFIRSKETTKLDPSGTGLGLYVGKSFVEAHGGRMWAESGGIGKGAVFSFEIPLRNPSVRAGGS